MPNDPIPPDVRRWLDQQDRAERDELETTWTLAGLADDAPPADAPDPPTDAAWSRLDALLDAPEADPAAVQKGLRAWQERSLPASAAPTTAVPPALFARPTVWAGLLAAAAFVIVAVFWMQPVTIEAGAQVATASLPDGSTVTLAPGSEIAYARGLRGDARRVEIEGQAVFSVVTDGRPFVVETFNAEVEVLGTVFDVAAWPEAEETAVALVEGSVRLRSGAGAVVLQPGQASRVSASAAPTPPASVDVAAVSAWQSGGFSVVDAPLAAVAEAVEARFGRPVVLNGVDASRRLTLYLPTADTPDTVLLDVAAYLGLRLQATSDSLVLTR